jgi:Thiol-activated cytolysin/FG-GAP-like repeat
MVGIRNVLRTTVGALIALGTATGCGSNNVTGGNAVSGDVNSYLSDSLPSWSQFTADVNQSDQPPTPTGDPPDTSQAVVPEVSQIEDDGSVTVVPDVTYRCVSTPYTLRSNPQQIVMYSPDVDILWPGALIQGKSRKALGSFLPLTIAERDSIKVSIPSFANNDNFRVVFPDQADVGQAIGSIVGNATQSGLSAPSTISFKMDTYNSEEEYGLSIGVSGHYLGFSASAQGDLSKSAGETTITAQFFQKMFEVVVAPPQTPESFFSSDFTPEKLQQQVSLGKIGPDNIPIYVSNVVYGRMMMFSLTSSASESDLRGTVQAGYEGIGGGVSTTLTAKQKKILQTSKIAVTSLGGDAQATLDVIRSGDWSQYFTNAAPLSSAAPLSYTFRNLGDGSVAGVTESDKYNITSCQAIPATPGTFKFLDPQDNTLPFASGAGVQALAGDVDGDGRTDLIFNRLAGTANETYVGLANGDGTFRFTPVVTHPDAAPEGWGNYTVHVGDINGDGKADLIWNYLGTQNKTYVGIGNGDGTFGFPSVRVDTTAADWTGYQALVGDVQGPTGSADGLRDMVWNLRTGSTNTVAVGVSQGNSTFDFLNPVALSGGAWTAFTAAVGDVDGNASEDLIFNALAAGALQNRTYFARSNGNGTWTLSGAMDNPKFSSWSGFVRLVGDVNGDGEADVVWVDTAVTNPVISVGLSTGSSLNFLAADTAATYNQSAPYKVLLADVDGDGHEDLVFNVDTAGVNRAFVALATPSGGFDFSPLPQDHPVTSENWSQFTWFVADVNGDKRADLVWVHPAATNRIYVALAKP